MIREEQWWNNTLWLTTTRCTHIQQLQRKREEIEIHFVTNYDHHDTISDLDREMKEFESKKERKGQRATAGGHTHYYIMNCDILTVS